MLKMKRNNINWETVDFSSLSREAQTDLFRRSRDSLADDPYRPHYHFSPPGAGLHDPAGLCFWQGKYHLFYLFITPTIKWARGHAVSDDLVHWQDQPIAGHAIHGGTGQVWADCDRAVMGYATNKHSAVSLATASDPLLLDWVEHPDNPVLQPGNDNTIWRQNCVFHMTVRTSEFQSTVEFPNGRGTLELYRSRDLAAWNSMGNLFEDVHFEEAGGDCSCNNFLPIGDGKHLLLFFSHKRQNALYYVGTFDSEKGRYRIESRGRMNYGILGRGSVHAPSGFVDPKGRCIAIWNVKENRTQKGWEQLMSLPRHLSLNAEVSEKAQAVHPLRIEPVAELENLRCDPVHIEDVEVPANGEYVVPGVEEKSLELVAEIDPMNAREIGLRVLRSPDGEERADITLFMRESRGSGTRTLMLDVSNASLDPAVQSRSPEFGPLHLEDGESLRLRVFVDHSIVEVFANARQCLTLRAYPSRDDSSGVSVFARGGEARLVSLTAWRMRSVWPAP